MRPHNSIGQFYDDDAGKRAFVRDLFNRSARHYDRIGRVGFLGTGHFYRKRALQMAGLRPGMAMLDVACGTGAVTRAAVQLLAGRGRVCGIDPSEGMLAVARKSVTAEFFLAQAEDLPFEDASFDFLTMGYALRHVTDLDRAFAEYRRVLKPGGIILILEISRPGSWVGLVTAKFYFRDALPALSWLMTGSNDDRRMMSYYWDTIEACVPPDAIQTALGRAEFADVRRRVELGVFSDYTGTRTAPPAKS